MEATPSARTPWPATWPCCRAADIRAGRRDPSNYSTAWMMLVSYCAVQLQRDALVHGAGGGTGIAAPQIAKRYGAEGRSVSQ